MDCPTKPITIPGAVHRPSPAENSVMQNTNMIQACKEHIDIFGRNSDFQRLYGNMPELKGYKPQDPPAFCHGMTTEAQRKDWRYLYPGTQPAHVRRRGTPPASPVPQQTTTTRQCEPHNIERQGDRRQAECLQTTTGHTSRKGKQVAQYEIEVARQAPPTGTDRKQNMVVWKALPPIVEPTNKTAADFSRRRKRTIRFKQPSENADDEDRPSNPSNECAVASDVKSTPPAGPHGRQAVHSRYRQQPPISTTYSRGIPRPAFRTGLTKDQIDHEKLRVQQMIARISRAEMHCLVERGRDRTAVPKYKDNYECDMGAWSTLEHNEATF